MNNSAIEKKLHQFFEDFDLSKTEKLSLLEWITVNQVDSADLNFIRNRSFEMVKEAARTQPQHTTKSINWLEKVVKSLDSYREQNLSSKQSGYFSPGVGCRDKIISLINGAKSKIDVCVFTISDNQITDALLRAKQRGISVRVLSDNDKVFDRGSDVQQLADNNIAVRVDNTANHMHHKFAIVDERLLINGSFNWTRSATKYNEENIVINDNSQLISQFSSAFESLWTKCSILESEK